MTESDSTTAAPAIGLGSAARDLYRALWRHAEGVRSHMLGAAGLLSAAQLLRLTMPWLAAQATNALQQDHMDLAGRWILYLIGIYLLSWLVHGPGRVLERNVGVRVRERLADQLYARIAAAPLAWRDGRHSGELQHRVVQSSRALSDFAQNQFGYLQSAFNFVGPIVALALLSRTSGLIAVTGYVIMAIIIMRFDRALMQLARAENDAERRYAAALLDFIGNAGTVIGLRLQAASRKLLGRRMDAVMAPLRRAVMVNEGKWFAVDLLGMGLTWILVVVYVLQSRQPGQAVLLGKVFMIYQYAQQAASVVGAMASNFQSFARMHTDYRGADPIWAAPGDPDAAVSAVVPDAPWRSLTLRGVTWRYPDDARGGLHGIDLLLQRGARVALIGPSGGGKSTLLRALAGLYHPQQGELRRDGAAQDWAELRSLATLIPQEAEVFEASVEENLTFGEPADTDALHSAVQTGVFDEVLQRLPAGLASAISERGGNLSGGQRQRLALARGALAARGSSLLLLDEPTSALDPQAEGRVFDRMFAAFPSACIVASVHRPSLFPRFDTIVVVEAGRVVDAGPREEVLGRRTH
ncbi:ATP-binding cassette domain-containing protein [Cupriavidus pinatubonensis]|uniref:Heterocyst differentiation ATP-binding protein HepA n=1 Tax=Cupriavidus pinatubonensis TaxID=248026 RepID=A0ABM8WC77_9BURK|nr:ABC transporter ATP-binding protein [Cupriavidus pinatubonensis]CAG9164865.1 Heterocyst differentiation ATP-binding protein HepA [Cupriavidus pinatubonensis]